MESIPRHIHLTFRPFVIGSGVAVLIGVGTVAAWRSAHPFGLKWFCLALAAALGPVVAYGYGFLRALPRASRLERPKIEASLVQRWSDFVRTSAVVAIILTCVCWTVVATSRTMTVSLTETGSFVNLFVLGTLTSRPDLCVIGAAVAASLMLVCVAASEQYLACTMGQPIASAVTSRRTGLQTIAGKCASWLLARLRAPVALAVGGVLLIFSLISPVFLFSDAAGLQVVSGQEKWPVEEFTLAGPTVGIVSRVGRCAYISMLVIAVFGLTAILLRRRGDLLRRSRAALALSTVIALFLACDLTAGVARLDSTVPPVLNVIVFGIIWLVPVTIWVWRAGSPGVDRDRIRIAVMVFYLPIVFVGLALIPIALTFSPSYALFLIGTAIVVLGFANSRASINAQQQQSVQS